MSNTAYKTYMTYTKTENQNLIPPHGGYRKLASYQMAEVVYDLTVRFCKRYKSYMTYKTYEQMIGAARSGKQNIAEGSVASGTSKKTELKLIGVARASLEELLQDYLDFLREHNFSLWEKSSQPAKEVRQLAYKSNKSYTSYSRFLEEPESAANTLICLIHQTNYLLDRQLKALETAFLENGGFTEKLYHSRQMARSSDRLKRSL